uniref:Uncharacterized protein n=1 Tax=Anguilla anguilla TaxID=7936 RepID=A0A0E9XH96_ANGAN
MYSVRVDLRNHALYLQSS